MATAIALLLATALAAGAANTRDGRAALQAAVDGHDAVLEPATRAERAGLASLYQPGDFSPLWLDGAGHPGSAAREARQMLDGAASDGLDPGDYYQAVLARLGARLDAPSPSARDLARFDAALSAGTLRYLGDLHVGRIDPAAVGYRLHRPAESHDLPSMLRRAILEHRVSALAGDLRPGLAPYGLLRSMLSRYRALAADPGLAVPRTAVVVHPGDAYEDAHALHRYLVAVGDIDQGEAAGGGRYDEALADGVRRFQERHGLSVDGVLGPRTMAAVGVPLRWRVRQIELSLERLRWLPDLGDRIVAVNIPTFRLWARDRRSPTAPALGMAAIVGRAVVTQTPVLWKDMREVVFRPYWNVPRSILRKEILPALDKHPGYLAREQMEIVRGAGDAAPVVEPSADALAGLRAGMLRLRQRPGPGNALGLIKFVFPNEDDVYMHGTPGQALFASSRRDFSHGCVRVEDPVALAEWVLGGEPEWTRDRIIAATVGTETVRVPVSRPVQVVLFYTTAVVTPEDGTIHFADDIYGHDARLDRALAARRPAR